MLKLSLKLQHNSLDSRLVEISRMFYEGGLSKTQIASAENLSITHVNRLLREAQRQGIVEISIRSPRFEDLESQIVKNFGLRDVHVIQYTENKDTLRTELGREAGAYFDGCVSDGSRVGVSSGWTIFEMVSRISEKPRKISVHPLNAIVDLDTTITGISANISATILWFKSRPLATGHRAEMFFPDAICESLAARSKEILESQAVSELRMHIRHLDAYFLGAGEVRSESHFYSLLRQLDFQMAATAPQDIVGDIAFNALDAHGSAIRTGIEDLLFHIEAGELRRAAADKSKIVALVAGGKRKHSVIKSAIEGSLCNALITDSATARMLLDFRP